MTLADAERHVLNLAAGHTLTAADVVAVQVFHGGLCQCRDRAEELGHRLRSLDAMAARLSNGVAAGHRHLNGHAPEAAPKAEG